MTLFLQVQQLNDSIRFFLKQKSFLNGFKENLQLSLCQRLLASRAQALEGAQPLRGPEEAVERAGTAISHRLRCAVGEGQVLQVPAAAAAGAVMVVEQLQGRAQRFMNSI